VRLEERIVRLAMAGQTSDLTETRLDEAGDDPEGAFDLLPGVSGHPDGDDDRVPDPDGRASADRADRRNGQARLRALPSIGPGQRTPA
jgi:hypothetical protein